MQNIQAKMGKSSEDFWKLAKKRGFVKNSEVVATHGVRLAWLKSKEVGLGHVHANFVTTYLHVKTDDPKVSAQMRERAETTGHAASSGWGRVD